jgi:hypothetical protein
MSLINNINEVLHRIRVRLYPNYLQKGEGQYIARTINEASLSIEQVCAALKNRGGFTGNYENLVEYIRQFFDEAAYQLCDGFGINMKYFSIHPNVGGTFNSEKEAHDPKKHPISFRFRSGSSLRRLIPNIQVEIEGISDSSGWIEEFLDVEREAVNSIFVPGNQFVIQGHKIKVAGEDPGVGVYFVPVEDPSKAVRVACLAENSKSKIIGVTPSTGYSQNKLEIRTQYTSSGTFFLKAPRIITGDFILEEA